MAVDDKVAVLSDDAGEDQRFTGQSIVMQKVRSAMCVPLIGSENRVLGVLYVDNFSMKRFGESDLDFLIAFSGIAAVALENGQLAERIKKEALVRSIENSSLLVYEDTGHLVLWEQPGRVANDATRFMETVVLASQSHG